MRRLVSPVTLREVYAYPGEHTVKMLIDPAASPGIDSVSVDVRNSDGQTMPFTHKRWGTKLTITFVTDSTTPDGMCCIDVLLRRLRSKPVLERFSCWSVK